MNISILPDIFISPADLWPGATIDDVSRVVSTLQTAGFRAYRHNRPEETNIPGVLTLADTFRQAVVTAAETAVQQAHEQNERATAVQIDQARAAVAAAIAKRDQAQTDLETAVARLREIEGGV